MDFKLKIVAAFAVLSSNLLLTECTNGFHHPIGSKINAGNKGASEINKPFNDGNSFNRPKGTNIEGDVCSFCLLAINTVKDKLQNNNTRENVIRTLKILCSCLPTEMKKQCDKLITDSYDDLINMLVAGLAPEQICKELKLCKTSKLPKEGVSEQEKSKPAEEKNLHDRPKPDPSVVQII